MTSWTLTNYSYQSSLGGLYKRNLNRSQVKFAGGCGAVPLRDLTILYDRPTSRRPPSANSAGRRGADNTRQLLAMPRDQSPSPERDRYREGPLYPPPKTSRQYSHVQRARTGGCPYWYAPRTTLGRWPSDRVG